VLSCCDFADFNGNALVYIIASLTMSIECFTYALGTLFLEACDVIIYLRHS